MDDQRQNTSSALIEHAIPMRQGRCPEARNALHVESEALITFGWGFVGHQMLQEGCRCVGTRIYTPGLHHRVSILPPHCYASATAWRASTFPSLQLCFSTLIIIELSSTTIHRADNHIKHYKKSQGLLEYRGYILVQKIKIRSLKNSISCRSITFE